jgi:hypothetical protein
MKTMIVVIKGTVLDVRGTGLRDPAPHRQELVPVDQQ